MNFEPFNNHNVFMERESEYTKPLLQIHDGPYCFSTGCPLYKMDIYAEAKTLMDAENEFK